MKYLSICVFIAITLCACHQEKSYDYFLLHPRDLEQTYERCSQLSGPEAYYDQECVAAINAAQTLKDLFMSLINNRQEFGQKLLDTQMALAKTKDQLQVAKKELKAMKTASENESIKERQQQITQLLEAEQREEFDIKMMWGVLRLLQPQFGG